jgi:hypothetical protein
MTTKGLFPSIRRMSNITWLYKTKFQNSHSSDDVLWSMGFQRMQKHPQEAVKADKDNAAGPFLPAFSVSHPTSFQGLPATILLISIRCQKHQNVIDIGTL